MKNIINTISKILKSILFGSLDILPNIKENIKSDIGGKDKFDFIRLATYIIQLLLIVAFITGKITFDDLKELLKQF